MSVTAVSVKLTEEDRKRLAIIAKKTKRSVHYLMREAVQMRMADLEWKLEFTREADEAWKEYKETGLFVSSEAMKKWAVEGGELPPLEKEPWAK
jgi:predicted transcriptional regulator